MKKIVCYIDSMQMGGAQRVMNNLTSHFSDMGYKTILINDIVPENGIPEYEINNKVERLFLDKESFPENRVKKNIKRIFILRQIIKNEKPDVTVSFLGPPNIRMLIATVGLKTRKIVSVRNDPYREYGGGIKKHIARHLFNLSDGCVFQTRDAANYFSDRVKWKSEIIVNPVKDVFFRTKHVPDRKTIVMVGRLNKQKNYSMAISAFSTIANKYKDIKMNIYGEGKLREVLQEQINVLGLEERVFLKGRSDSIEKCLSSATLFLMTSDYEGMPNALMEAMAVGVPVISTDCPCGGPNSLIKDNVNGILIPCSDVTRLAKEIDRVLADNKLQYILGLNARKKAKEFASDSVLAQWDRFLFKEGKNNE